MMGDMERETRNLIEDQEREFDGGISVRIATMKKIIMELK
jgi:hypothetical protein